MSCSRTSSFTALTLALVAPNLLVGQHLEHASVDSIVLQRGWCFGPCPAYRLSITRSGVVHFKFRNPGDAGGSGTDTIPVANFLKLVAIDVAHADFFALPDKIANEPKYCRFRATDHSTVIVTVFAAGGQTKRVEDYLGCMLAPASLREFEDHIDDVAHSSRWLRRAGGVH